LESVERYVTDAMAQAERSGKQNLRSRFYILLSNVSILYSEDVESSNDFANKAELLSGENDRLILVTSLLWKANSAFLTGDEACLRNVLARLNERKTSADVLNVVPVRMKAMAAAWQGHITEARNALRDRISPDCFSYGFDYQYWRALYALLCVADAQDAEARSILQNTEPPTKFPDAWIFPRRQTQRAKVLVAIAECLVGRNTNAERLLKAVEPNDGRTRALYEVALVVQAAAKREVHESLDSALDALESAGSGGLRKFLSVVLPRALERFQGTPNDVLITEAERSVLRALARGETPKEIAHQTGRSVHTVRTLAQRAAEKLGCSGRHQTIAAARRLGLIAE
jgi:DNA-binding CsgD family transcriptional regulator